MAILTNPLPKDNPLAIKLKVDTAINNISLDPVETYEVIINQIVSPISTPSVTALKTITQIGSNPYVKKINIKNNSTALKVYLPLFNNGNTIYIVPAVVDNNYQDGYRDLVSVNDLSASLSSGGGSWSQTLENWIFKLNYATPPTKTTTMTQVLSLAIKGVDTNRADKTKIITVTLQALAKTYGV